MSGARAFLLAAGGTGGHMIPAHALAVELGRRGHRVHLVTDARGARIPGIFDMLEPKVLTAGRLGGGPLGYLRAARDISRGRAEAGRYIREVAPAAAVGFGGYPAFPSLWAARARGVPTVLHEQNAVLGRVNRLLARGAKAIATAYDTVQRVPASAANRVELVGNPVRDEVARLHDEPYPELTADGIFRVLVTGGSQGANILSDVVPDGLGLLPPAFRARLQVTQQCRPEDIDRVRARYAALGIPADLATYIADMPHALAWTHLVIARAGASTIAELTTAGRPAILVPLPSATDDHQTFNAREMARTGGARVIAQSRFTPPELAKQMQKLGLEPDALTYAASRARAAGRPHATRDLADLVERIADGGPARQQVGFAKGSVRARPMKVTA